MAWMGVADTSVVINGVTVKHDGVKLSDWIDCTSGMSFTVWYKQVLSAGTPAHNIYVHVSPLSAQYLNDLVKAGTDTTEYYVSATLATGVTTESTLLRYTSTTLDTPFNSLRVYVTGGGAAEDTVCTAYVTRFN